MPAFALVPLLAALLLAGCELPGAESPEKIAQAKEADGKAIGSACRHAGRAIEDCYLLNPKAQRAAVFAGWREMDEYMRENKLEAVAPVVMRPGSKPAEADLAATTDAPAPEPKSPAKNKAHSS